LGVAVVLVPFLIPVRRPEGLVDAEDLADDDSCFADIGGVRLHYKDSGPRDAAETIVFLHGFASSLYSWRHVTPRLARTYRVIVFDRPGFGLAGRPLRGDWEGANPYTLESSVDQTLGLLDSLGVDKATFVGHSQGASIAVLIAQKAPQRVRGLVLVNAPVASRRFRSLPERWVHRLRRVPQVERLAPLLPRPFFGDNARAVMAKAYHDPSRLSDETVELELKATHVKDWDRSYVELAPAQTGLHVPAALASVTQPTLVIAGRDDHTVPWRDQVRASRAIVGSKLVTLYRSGHVVPEERPEELLALVDEFVSGLSE
jgi:pimeloyl-ACP methyl ester carboxylesterase